MDMTIQNHDPVFLNWKNQAAGARAFKGVAVILWVIAIVGWVMLLHKLSQTSSFALQFSDRVHEQLGEWVFALGAITLVALVVGIMAIAASVRVKRTRETLISGLRSSLENATNEGQRSNIESRLRELGV